jgi:uracil-DNA glycosylase family 4
LFSIKQSYANCSICPLLHNPSCILDTNCEKNLCDVDILYVAENPGKEEIIDGKPLVGKAGKMFRKYFSKYGLNKMKYLITNVVLCQTLNPDGTTGNPEDKVIALCKENLFKLIDVCKPKIIVAMGTSVMKAFEIATSGITNLRGKTYEWKGYKIFLTVHPSFVNRNPAFEEKFENDLEAVSIMFNPNKVKLEKEEKITTKGVYHYKIPDKFYTNEYRLIDVQFLGRMNQIIYIFRDSKNKKVYHIENDEYVCYQISKEQKAKKIVPYDELNQVKIKYKQKVTLDPDITYEGDVRLTAKHALDYYLHNKGEASKIDSNIMFCDIEVDTGKSREFPKPIDAKFPISLITTKYHGKRTAYVLDNKSEKIKDIPDVHMKTFLTEKELVLNFIKDFKDSDPDFLSGWNFISFDMEYIFNRLLQIKIPQTKISKFEEFFVDGQRFICNLCGTVVLDQEYLYKMFTFTKKENYKLGFIAQEELGKTKLELPLPINEMYWKKLNDFIQYAMRDTDLLEDLENKLKHINLLNELRLICNTSFQAGSSSFGQIDSIVLSFLKPKGLASKNSDPHVKKDEYPGAFVYDPIPGIYNNVTDFDFTSLYPSIIITYNIGVNNFMMKFKDPQLGYNLIYGNSLPDEFDLIIDPTYEAKEVKVKREDFLKKLKESNLIYTINGCFFKQHDKQKSIYSEILDNLMGSRKQYKKKMLEAKEAGQADNIILYNTRQLVYKVLANSLYGVVANKAFRFFDVSCAAAVTLSGQEALKTSIIEADNFMESLNLKTKYQQPKELTKKEMYSDVMPDRKTKYIITGDTDSIFCCFEKFPGKKTDDDIKALCDQVQNFLNKQIIPVIVQKHNVNLANNRLDLKNELIISRGLFLAKKRYAIRVVNQEGKKVDEIVFMGVENKRSDYPRKSKEFLAELTELILKSEKISLSKLLEFIKRQEVEFISLIRAGDKSIARPVSFTREESNYKVVPQGVRAMKTWNEIMYDIHTVGSKAYMFKVSGFNRDIAPSEIIDNFDKFAKVNKLEVVAIPDEEHSLPKYFIPDVKEQLKFSFTDRYELLIKPLMTVKNSDSVLSI